MHSSTDKLLHYTKVKYNRLAKDTMNGPGKFGVFIFFCILIVGIHDVFNAKMEKNTALCQNNCQKTHGFEVKKEKIMKEIFPQTFGTNNQEKKNQKLAYMTIIKNNQSIKEKKATEMENHDYILDFVRSNNNENGEEILEPTVFYNM